MQRTRNQAPMPAFLRRFSWTLAALFGLQPIASGATSIDFETIPGVPSSDGLEIHDQFLADHGVSFGLDFDGDHQPDVGAAPRLKQVGSPSWGFQNDYAAVPDLAWPGYEAQLGSWFLTAAVPGAGAALVISYTGAVAAAGGEIWDIDGNPQQGTEQWLVQALAADHSVLDSVLSPSGSVLDPSGLNAKPWLFSFDHGIEEIWGLRIEFVGTKTTGIGLAFDNFWPSEVPQPPVPEPGTVALVGAGLAMLGARRRR